MGSTSYSKSSLASMEAVAFALHVLGKQHGMNYHGSSLEYRLKMIEKLSLPNSINFEYSLTREYSKK